MPWVQDCLCTRREGRDKRGNFHFSTSFEGSGKFRDTSGVVQGDYEIATEPARVKFVNWLAGFNCEGIKTLLEISMIRDGVTS